MAEEQINGWFFCLRSLNCLLNVILVICSRPQPLISDISSLLRCCPLDRVSWFGSQTLNYGQGRMPPQLLL